MLFMPLPKLIHLFLRHDNSGTQKLLKTPFIVSVHLKILQLLKLKVAKINKWGFLIGSGDGKYFRKLIARGHLLGTKE